MRLSQGKLFCTLTGGINEVYYLSPRGESVEGTMVVGNEGERARYIAGTWFPSLRYGEQSINRGGGLLCLARVA